ncbi:MAG: ABC transporter substrate-binding protein [Burkholderiales bacterium]|jgi:ABC-type branched-subunit amino acid transport system substrate-binding protein|nr:ABC transporter substrate-binding protein [Burkholderiales bacterium]
MLQQKKLLAALAALVLSATAWAQSPGVTATSVVVGQSAPLTGPAAALGTEMRLGAKLYFDQVNAQGGVNGRRIELVSLDDGYEPAKTDANTKKLINDEKVFALFGYVGTPTSMAALPIFTEAKVPFFGPFTGAESLRDPFNRNIFHIRASYYDETEKIVEQLVTTGLTKIAVFYQNDAYGKAGLAGVERALKARNIPLVATATVERNTTDVAKAVSEIVPKQPNAIVMISAYKSIAAFVRAAQKAGFGGQFHNVSFVGSKALADELAQDGVGVAISQVVPFPWSPTTPVVKEYQQAMAKAGEKTISFTSLEGYVAAKVFVEGLRRAGKDLTREKLVEGLEKGPIDVGGFQVNYTPANHAGSKFVELTIIVKDGKFAK